MSNLKVAVLVPPEDPTNAADRADTFVQAAEISECLSILGNECLTIIFGDDRGATEERLLDELPDVVFNLVEDVSEGADHLHVATALLDRLRLRYTGAPTVALEALGDKREMKRRLMDTGLPVAPDATDGPADAGYIVKSATEHASIGIDATSVVSGRAIAQALTARRQAERGGTWFAEQYIDGREFNLALLETGAGIVPLPVSEILFLDHAGRPKVVGYAEKWAEDSAAYASTPRSFATASADAPLHAELTRLSLAAWHLFGLKGYARVDFRVDDLGAPYILEVNANPCLAADAGFCAAAAEAGLSQTDIVAHLIETALA
jgi:D-alanine-D-alanine ligase